MSICMIKSVNTISSLEIKIAKLKHFPWSHRLELREFSVTLRGKSGSAFRDPACTFETGEARGADLLQMSHYLGQK